MSNNLKSKINEYSKYIRSCNKLNRPEWIYGFITNPPNESYLKTLCTESEEEINKKCAESGIKTDGVPLHSRVEQCYGYTVPRRIPRKFMPLRCGDINTLSRNTIKIGEGGFATVVSRCNELGKQCRAVRVTYKNNNKCTESQPSLSSMMMYHNRDTTGIVPKIYQSEYCGDSSQNVCSFTDMELIHGYTLHTILVKFNSSKHDANKIFNSLYNSLVNFWKIYPSGHGDLNPGNIILKTPSEQWSRANNYWDSIYAWADKVFKKNSTIPAEWIFIDLGNIPEDKKNRTIVDDLYTLTYYIVSRLSDKKYNEENSLYRDMFVRLFDATMNSQNKYSANCGVNSKEQCTWEYFLQYVNKNVRHSLTGGLSNIKAKHTDIEYMKLLHKYFHRYFGWSFVTG